MRTGGCYCREWQLPRKTSLTAEAIRYELSDDSARDFSVCYCEGCKYASSSR
jgi:hypothetical protein